MNTSILLALDNEKIEYFKSLFKNNYPEFNLFIANNVKDAISIVNQNRIALSILDFVINNSNGIEIADVLKTKDENSQVIFVTSRGISSSNIADFDIIDGFIYTPFSENLVIKQLNFHINYYKKALNILYSQEVFKKLADEINNIIFIVDKKLNILYSNFEFLNSFGQISYLDKLRRFFPGVIIDFIKEKIENISDDFSNNHLEFIFKEEHYKVNIFNYFCDNSAFIIFINFFKPDLNGDNNYAYFKDYIYKQYTTYRKILSEQLPVFKKFSINICEILFSNNASSIIYRFYKDKERLYYVVLKTLDNSVSSYYSSAIFKEFIDKNIDKLKKDIDLFLKSFQDFYYSNKFKEIINIFTGYIDEKKEEISFSLCGFNQPRIVDNNNVLNNLFVKEWNFPIGIAKNYFDYKKASFDFSNFAKFSMYSDEIVEFTHKNGKDIDYFIIDKFLTSNINNALEDLRMIKDSENIKNKTGFLLFFNFNKPIKERVTVNRSSSIDGITNSILDIINRFDISFGFKKRCFVVLEEIISNMIKYGLGGKISYKIDHQKVIFIFQNISDTSFNPWDFINAIDNKNDEDLIRNNIIKNVKSDSLKLGLYMTEKFSDRFWATKDGKYICVILKIEPKMPFILE
ncbi:MAG TPA: hypothetical protein PKW55_05495 [Spirochaetota bacterium]|nr:hypothetical protein [Spirochaetota bacterium]HOM37593.1 hypothetical protein [Spirochaetota bacterium]HPQ49436.1 hypothetical protein [Spirochaetota bacterium]